MYMYCTHVYVQYVNLDIEIFEKEIDFTGMVGSESVKAGGKCPTVGHCSVYRLSNTFTVYQTFFSFFTTAPA